MVFGLIKTKTQKFAHLSLLNMEYTIELLKKDLSKQVIRKLATEKEQDANNDVRFIEAYSNKVNIIENRILELKKAIEILKR